MAVPTPSLIVTSLNASPYVDHGDPTVVNSTHGALDGTDLDGVGDYKTTPALEPFAASSGSQQSFRLPVKGLAAGNGIYMGMYDGSSNANAVFYIVIASGGSGVSNLRLRWFNGGSNSIRTESVPVYDILADGNLHVIHGTVNGNDANIYLDGVELVYAAKDGTTGSGFSGVKSGSVTPLSVGAWADGQLALKSEVHPMAFWDSVTLTDAQVLEDYNNYLAGPVQVWSIDRYNYLNFMNNSTSVKVKWGRKNEDTTSQKERGFFIHSLSDAGIITAAEKSAIETKINNKEGIN